MEQSVQTAAFIYGLISLVTLIVFFVMAYNVSQIKNSLSHKKVYTPYSRKINVKLEQDEIDSKLSIEPYQSDPDRLAALKNHLEAWKLRR